jgi:hypothetical protein
MDVGTADGGPPYLDQNIIVSDLGQGDIFHPDAAFGFCFY